MMSLSFGLQRAATRGLLHNKTRRRRSGGGASLFLGTIRREESVKVRAFTIQRPLNTEADDCRHEKHAHVRPRLRSPRIVRLLRRLIAAGDAPAPTAADQHDPDAPRLLAYIRYSRIARLAC